MSPMLSGTFSGSVVVTASLQKNMNPKSMMMVLKETNKRIGNDFDVDQEFVESTPFASYLEKMPLFQFVHSFMK